MSLAPRLMILVSLVSSSVFADDWPQWRGPNRDGTWNETRIVEKFEADQIELRWKVKIGAGYSGPTVAKRRVYVTDRIVEPKQIERVHCFDSKSGIKIWSYEYDCAYRIGYAESADGLSWTRMDNKVGIDVSVDGFDSDMIEYATIVSHAGHKYMFYNGNNYGEDGIGLAVSV